MMPSGSVKVLDMKKFKYLANQFWWTEEPSSIAENSVITAK